jgi:very-short-patch-repair endonuclease
MTKLEFITRQLAKAQKKRFEHYVVNRLWSRLDDSRVKFVTQQFVARPDGRAMTDMYFPQIGMHVEVDEGFHKLQPTADALREADIINATGHEILRVDVTKDIENINCDIDEIVQRIREKIAADEHFRPWDLEAEMDPKTYIERGYIDIEDDVVFRTMVDAANCFGQNIAQKGIWTGGAKHGVEPNTLIWFPKLYPNKDWDNQLSDDEETITEYSDNTEYMHKHIDRVLKAREFTRIVFPKIKGPLGDTLYRFKGRYELDQEATNYETGFVWRRTATKVKTYRFGEVVRMGVEAEPISDVEEIFETYIRNLSGKDKLRLAVLILQNAEETS